MKRKLSLLLAMVLAMTMVMGIGVTAFADTDPRFETLPLVVECDLSGDEAHKMGCDHFYIFEVIGDNMVARVYSEGSAIPDLDGDDWAFDQVDYDGPGWYHWNEASDSYIKCTSSGTTPDDPTPSGSSSPAHVHSFQWQTITEPTKDTDGLEGEVCSCGATRNTQKLSAYGYALNQYATPMINAAKAGQTITFELGEWNSFPKAFMEKIAAKSMEGVTFVFHYKWNHVKQEITIPFGTAVDTQFDWYGPAKMAELYGAN